MLKQLTLAGALLTGLAATQAGAQVLTMSTTNPGGLGHSIGSAIARVVSDYTDLRMVVVPSGGATMQAIAGGEAECGVSNGHGLSYFVTGTEIFEAEGPHDNLRMVAAVLPSLVAMYVREDSSIQTLTDLAGMRYPGDLNAQPDINIYYETYLDWAGLGRDDVQIVPAQSIVQAADDFAAGRNDAFVFSVNTAKVLEVESAVGGLRVINVEDTPETREILNRNLPGAFFTQMQPGSAPQIVEPTNTLSVWILITCADTVPDDVVEQMVSAIYSHPEELAASFAGFNAFNPRQMAPALPGVSYHPGAVPFYKDQGIYYGE